MADELQLSIEKMIYGGEGLAHAEGNTVFVPFVLPGGTGARHGADAEEEADSREPGGSGEGFRRSRIAAECPHFRVCGGCHYQHIEIGEQVRLKKEILRETLSRLGGVQWAGEIKEHTAQPYGYRNRAQWAYRDALPRAFGYFLPESAHILPIDQCPVLSPRLAETFLQLQELARGNSLPPGVLEVEAFADGADEKIALNVAFERFPEPPKALASEIQVRDFRLWRAC